MNLYTDDNPKTTLKGLGFKNKDKAIETIYKVEKYFDNLMREQGIPGYTPPNVLPKIYIMNKEESYKYYLKQKMYRILGMMNRAKGMLNKVSDEKKQNFKEAISVFEIWMNKYKKYKKKISLCI